VLLVVADTPVAGTVERISSWLERLSGKKSICLVGRNYPHNAFPLSNPPLSSVNDPAQYLSTAAGNSDVIFLHNVFDQRTIDVIANSRSPQARVVYQYHSPPNEPPAYDYPFLGSPNYDRILAVAQGYGRFVKDVVLVPNIVPDFEPKLAPPRERALLNPHLRSTNFRWSAKVRPADSGALKTVEPYLGGVRLKTMKDIFGRDVVTYAEARSALFMVSHVLDDLNTGLFHQTGVEALKSGCEVFSAADPLAMEEFCTATGSPPLPFEYVDGVQEVIGLLMDRAWRRDEHARMAARVRYAERFLSERRLAESYHRAVKDLL
jgi:hypothetical protein